MRSNPKLYLSVLYPVLLLMYPPKHAFLIKTEDVRILVFKHLFVLVLDGGTLQLLSMQLCVFVSEGGLQFIAVLLGLNHKAFWDYDALRAKMASFY